jgi:hypothetical protein
MLMRCGREYDDVAKVILHTDCGSPISDFAAAGISIPRRPTAKHGCTVHNLMMDNAYVYPLPVEPPAVRMFKDIAFGSVSSISLRSPTRFRRGVSSQIAGMLSKLLEHPFDLAKVRLQSQVLDPSARFDGPVDCLRKTWAREGFRGLYRVRTPHPSHLSFC